MKKFCVFLYSCILLCVLFNLNLKAQNHSSSSYKDKTNTLVSNYQNALIQKALWRPFENKVEDLIKDMDDDPTQGSGLSFDEMNSVRNYKSLLQAIIDFGDGIADGGYWQMFNGRTLKKIREYFPDVTFESFKGIDCVNFYKITVFNYTVIVARHNEKGILKNVFWWDANRGNKTLSASFTLIPGLYRQVWNNSEDLSNKGSGISINRCEFKMVYDEKYSPVKTFIDN